MQVLLALTMALLFRLLKWRTIKTNEFDRYIKPHLQIVKMAIISPFITHNTELLEPK